MNVRVFSAVVLLTTTASLLSSSSRLEPEKGRLPAGATERLLSKMAHEREDAFVTIISDSTAYTYRYLKSSRRISWPYLLAGVLGRRFPNYSVKYRQPAWSVQHPDLDSPARWDAWATLQEGRGGHTLWISNASVPGAPSMYVQGVNFDTFLVKTTPDLVILSLGHNQGDDLNCVLPDLEALTEPVTLKRPDTGIVLIGQNPHTDATGEHEMALKNRLIRMLAEDRGYGYVDVFDAFKRHGGAWAADLMTDSVHPNLTGQRVWCAEMAKLFPLTADRPVHHRSPSTLEARASQLVTNGRFEHWLRAGDAPSGWEVSNAAVTKDATNQESGYSVRLTATGPSDNGLFQRLPGVDRLKGKWVTVAARVYVGRGQPSTAGRVGILAKDASGNTVCAARSNYFTTRYKFGQGAFRWTASQCYVPPTAASVSVFLWADTESSHGIASFDRVSVTTGRDIHDNLRQ